MRAALAVSALLLALPASGASVVLLAGEGLATVTIDRGDGMPYSCQGVVSAAIVGGLLDLSFVQVQDPPSPRLYYNFCAIYARPHHVGAVALPVSGSAHAGWAGEREPGVACRAESVSIGPPAPYRTVQFTCGNWLGTVATLTVDGTVVEA